ncbi:histone-binding protein RBBP7 [Trypanosoma cruzi]|uniref:Uncharacterized protein n=1 Tax=Trypanosoma cruzi (strain CL Brener) TaxID=353153 RepID=Q4DG15_TRYCC|nr:hypothetical protein, conserved [Trypanosoma cruzi]EAN91458.1 hypothetical protein, conserved [Trypanosoma cruzi]RNC49423.1 histone-binding protein RBBP7 [Trypanosoma cruzi]|eukprot:XP_813309.1 hypothetical protein [Trypanosoma cruzi strain CL Brener]
MHDFKVGGVTVLWGQVLPVEEMALEVKCVPQATDIIAVQTFTGFVGGYNFFQSHGEGKCGVTVPGALLFGHRTNGFAVGWDAVKEDYLANAAHVRYSSSWDVLERPTATNDGEEEMVKDRT